MEALKAKVSEVKDEWNQAIFAFTEYTSTVLKRADQFMKADKGGTRSQDDSMTLLLTDLSEVVRKCKFVRSTIENASSPAPNNSHLCSVTNNSLSEVLREVNPSIFEEDAIENMPGPAPNSHLCSAANDSSEVLLEVNPSTYEEEVDSDAPSCEGSDSQQTVPKVFQAFSGDDHLGNLPTYKDISGNPPDFSITQVGDDSPPSYSRVAVTPGYPAGAFDFSLKQAFGNLFSVKVNHTSPLTKDVQTRLDNVLSVFFPSDAFRQEGATFKPLCDGVYAINVELCQYGSGEMDVWLCRRGHASYVGKTRGNMLETSVMKVKMLTQGQDHWIEVRALKGRPSVYWCNFSGFLLAKKPPPQSLAAATV